MIGAINPRVYERNGQVAKQEAGRLAIDMGFRLKQSANGKIKQIVLTTGGIRDYTKWLGAFNWLHACWLDRWLARQRREAMPAAKIAPMPIATHCKPVVASKPLSQGNPPVAVAKVREPPRGVYVDLDGNEMKVAKFA